MLQFALKTTMSCLICLFLMQGGHRLAPLWQKQRENSSSQFRDNHGLEYHFNCYASLSKIPTTTTKQQNKFGKKTIPFQLSYCWCFARLVPVGGHFRIIRFVRFLVKKVGINPENVLNMTSSDSQIDKPQRGRPKRAELPDVNINTGAQSINTERGTITMYSLQAFK